MPAKVCPRCGALYENLGSKTCPQCFAVLVAVNDDTAEELAAARAEVEQTPEFQQVKAEDDERFKEQSFNGCLAVIGLTFVTLVLAIVLIAVAAHRRHHVASSAPAQASRPGLGAVSVTEPLTTLPVAAATLDEVMPTQLPLLPPADGVWQRTESDQDLILPGTLTRIDHAIYQAAGGNTIDAYALPAGQPTAEQNQFRLGVTLSAQMQKRQATTVFFATEYWHYAALGPAAPNSPVDGMAFERALAAYFRDRAK